MTKIKSALPAPVELRVFRLLNDEIGTPCARCVRGPVVLRPGINEVDGDFARDWLEQNESGLLASHFAVIVDEEALDPPLPAEEEALDDPPLP
jgi:hypothetical protein